MVFQAHNLFPHMKVLQNVTAGPILVQHRKQADANSDAMQLLRIVGLAEKADQYPTNSPAASSNVSGSPELWRSNRISSSSTSPHRPLTPNSSAKSSKR